MATVPMTSVSMEIGIDHKSLVVEAWTKKQVRYRGVFLLPEAQNVLLAITKKASTAFPDSNQSTIDLQVDSTQFRILPNQ
jgi:hypothetical protein